VSKTKTKTYDFVESKVKVSGEATSPEKRPEMDHGEEVYFLARGVVKEVAFPEDKDGNINRVAKVKLEKGFVVDAEGAEELIAEERERVTGQGNIIAESKRVKAAANGKAEKSKEDEQPKKARASKKSSKKGARSLSVVGPSETTGENNASKDASDSEDLFDDEPNGNVIKEVDEKEVANAPVDEDDDEFDDDEDEFEDLFGDDEDDDE
jgi:hypothetical protein